MDPVLGSATTNNSLLLAQQSTQVHRVEHGGITIEVRELEGFFSASDWNNSPALQANVESRKAADDTRAYGDDIAKYIYQNGNEVWQKAAETYNASGGSVDPNLDVESVGNPGRNLRMSTDDVADIQATLDANPELTGLVLKEMAITDGYFESAPHIAWAEAAEQRTGGAIPAEWWIENDPFGGTAGNGPDIVPFGEYPGANSKIAMAHDTDWTLGRYFGAGPLSSLYDAEGFTPEQLGFVGLRPDHQWGHFADADVYTFGHADWNVQY